MLELAKTIFSKHADSLEAKDEKRLALEDKLSETYQTLGEVSIENENYPQAVEDLTMCLRRRQDFLPLDSRCIAETHYQLGVALGFDTQFDEAVNALNDAISVLEKRVSNLKKSKEAQESKEEAEKMEKEITEIEGLIPEIREKIADTKDMQQESVKRIGDRRLIEDAMAAKIAAEANKDQNGDGKESSPKKAAASISHLVKKRKKSEEEGEKAENGDVKKPHLEEGTNGSNGTAATASASNGTNGH